GSNFTLSLQNNVPGTGITYQWQESTVSGTGPWTPIPGANAKTLSTSQLVDKWYYCDVTCTNGPTTVGSNPLFVPMYNGAITLPQGFSTNTVTPNCWSVEQIAGTGLPYYSTVSGYGIGTGSVKFDWWTQINTTENALVSPEFTPIGAGQFFAFDAAGCYYATSVDVMYIEESSDGGLTWNTIVALDNAQAGGVLNTAATYIGNYTPPATDWVTLAYPLTAGTNRLRIRGDSAYGNNIYFDNLNITNVPPAYHATIGTGCYSVDNVDTLADQFIDAPTAKSVMDGNSLTFINTGSGYLALYTVGGGAAYVAPVTPTIHTVGDEGVATITPSTATPSPNGPVTQWTIHANGALTAGALSNPAGFGSDLAAVGAAANLGFWSFHDFNTGDGGQVVSEEVGNMTYITWDAVAGYLEPTDLSTFQFQINRTTGDVSIVWVSMHAINVANNYVAGTLAGVGATPTDGDLTIDTPFIMTKDQLAMELTVAGRPINGGPAPVYTVSNLPEYSPGAGFSTLAVIFGFTVFPGGIDLGPGPFDIGAAGCNGYITPDVIVIIGIVPFAPASFPIAWNIPGVPAQLWMQAASEFVPFSLPNGQNLGGKIVSNALEIFISSY
ncbi:MAG: hypothetical protein JNL12_10205, partial [Planctomycetes bacterium]|nr:hypothetical protein [Planctomycetota bacterium]